MDSQEPGPTHGLHHVVPGAEFANLADLATLFSLEGILAKSWEDISQAVLEPSHPYSVATIGTLRDEAPVVRSVMLREARKTSRTLSFYTDMRSTKVVDLASNPRIGWCFYDPTSRTQVIGRSTATIHHGDLVAHEHWERVPLFLRRYYMCDMPPGTHRNKITTALTPSLQVKGPTEEESLLGKQNFAVVSCILDRMEWLTIIDRGCLRAVFEWTGERWDSAWLTP